MTSRHLGLDVGGTNLKWAVVERDGDDWATLDRGRTTTDLSGPPASVVAQLGGVGRSAAKRWPGITSAGVGLPGGPYDQRTGVARVLVNIPGEWTGYPIAQRVEDAVGVPSGVINDARAFGLAELRAGAARGASTMVGLTLGTGVGGVVAVGGAVLLGHEGTAGEVGHQTLDPDGPDCNCGNRGCLEAFVRADRLAAACGAPTAEEAVARARAGDATAVAGLAAVGRWLGIGIANLITILAPDRVVVGGGVAAAGDLLLGPAREEIRRRVFMTSLAEVEITPAALGPWAGAIGAAIHGAEARGATGIAR